MSSNNVEFLCKHCGKIAIIKSDDSMYALAVNHCGSTINYQDPEKGDAAKIAYFKKLLEG